MNIRIDGAAGRTLMPDAELKQLLEEKREQDTGNERLQLFAFDRFERLLADAREYSSAGKAVEAQQSLDAARDYAKHVRDERLELELEGRIRMAQQRRA